MRGARDFNRGAGEPLDLDRQPRSVFAREVITHRPPCRFLMYIASLDTVFSEERGWCIIFPGAFVFITVIPSYCAALPVCCTLCL